MATYYFYTSDEQVPFRYLTPTRWFSQIPPPYKSTMSPLEYLEYAISDLEEGNPRGLVNAFGNAKRALHLNIDILLHQFGMFHRYQRVNFPTKLNLIDSMGILPVNLLKNVNIDRNFVEHEYTIPTKKRVSEAIDTAKLVLLASEKILESTPHEAVVGWKEPPGHFVLQLDPINGSIQLFRLVAKGHYRKTHSISHFAGRLRMMDGLLAPDIKIAKKPKIRIEIRKETRSQWGPIVRELINIQRRRTASKTYFDKENLLITMSITIPFELPKEFSWAEFMDRELIKKNKNRDERKRNNSHEESETGDS